MSIVGHILYGYPLSDTIKSENEALYFSECGKPLAFGLEIGRFTASGVTESRQFKRDPSATIIAQLSNKFDKLPELEKTEIVKFGPPRTFIVWTSE